MRVLIFTLYIFICLAGYGQSQIFMSDEILEVEIITDLKTLFRDIDPEKAQYHDALLYYIYADSAYSIPAKIKTRGIFRRDRTNCRIPPLSLKPQKLNDPLFNTSLRIKLVNPCMNTERFQQYLVKEYLAYRIYNILTDYSFKVRLLKIIYIDNRGKYPNFITYGFVIEPVKWLAQRLNVTEVETQGIIQNATYRPVLDIMSMFQYLIGNTDWSVPKLHNIKLLYSDSLASVIPIAYDFDFSGFVDPPYTKPPEIIPIRDVTERYYRGNCRSQEELQVVIEHFITKKEIIYDLINSDTLLNNRHKTQVINYINRFYQIISDSRAIKKEFIENCRNE